MNNKRKKKFVEIYFILYLAAMVLLIPGKESRHKNEHDNDKKPRIFQLPFSLKAEKSALYATVKLDSSGMGVVSLDSTNTIFYTGQIKDIKFDITIEDRNTRQVLALDKNSPETGNFFRYSTDENSQSLKFFWMPPLYDRKNKTYIVRVTAQAVSAEPGSLGLILEDKIQFSLDLNYVTDNGFNQLIATDSGIINGTLQPNTNVITGANGFSLPQTNLMLSPRDEIVKSIAYSSWENEITIFGLDPKTDLRKQPEIKIIREPDNKIGGTAKITGYTNSGLLIKGEVPGYGVMKVSVSVTRHADGKETIREFRVMPQLIDEPKFEPVLYPGIRYSFDPRLPILSNQKTYSVLKTSEGKVYSASDNGAAFSVTPSINDTGKILYFERYVDNNMIGQRHTVKISMFPIPEILRVSEVKPKTVRIFTNSYGTHEGRENYISRVEVLSGNANVHEIIGAQKNEDGKFIFKQTFEITPANITSDFNFKIQAVAINGQKSQPVVYLGR